MSTVISDVPNNEWHDKLKGKVDEKILHLKDSRGMFLLDKLDERNLRYFINNCVDKPWANHLFLSILISFDKNLDSQTIQNSTININLRLNDIFQVFNLNEMSEFNTEEHLYKYLKGTIYPEHSNSKRALLLRKYNSLINQTKKWFAHKVSVTQRENFEQFIFPIFPFNSSDFSFTKLATEQAEITRKNETDAIVPFLPKIRTEAHFRWNQMKRIYESFQKAIKRIKEQDIPLPMEFHYEEPTRIGERFYFRLWDKRSFILHHEEQFPETIVKQAQERKSTYSKNNNYHFLEFVKSESLHGDDEVEGIWFTDLIENNVLGNFFQKATKEEIKQKQDFLKFWGYMDMSSESKSPPFASGHKDIISFSVFLSRHKNNVKGIFFDVEPFYVGCTFGLLAIDILTTTGARINELLQISNTKECIQTKMVKEKRHYSFYAIPKGRDVVEEFYVSKQTMQIIQTISRMLKDHYGGKIPSVEYRYDRKHLFPEEKPYYFQYNHKAFKSNAVYACIRFLLHGLRFETQDGSPVIIKTHLLRHAFATEAVQRQKMPIDILAKILHQRDLTVTGYYSAPTPSQIAESVGELQDVISSYVDIDDALLRSPKQLQKELTEYSEKVGVFNNVLGGTCVTDYVCPTKMACLGCKAKIPQPEQEHELLEAIKVAEDMEKRFKKIGLEIEVRKAKEMRKQAKIELKEIDLIKKYREEQRYEPVIKSNTFW
ncbi:MULTISPECIES: site-specific integrase [Bacillus cereus group]|uniref:site-specific integrase n=1 Tax=Bacillus cereus group TaxID=86661 RepID=UPI000BEF4245|nr:MULTISPECIES: site-specific integrase [Bacillus cereus group]PEO35926.1 integrase [Bacillus wiedmannii]QWG70819.1 site-specific integrase [Bacillus mycoides]QWH23365.1 site-specific integrase [Bacillus mycoides]